MLGFVPQPNLRLESRGKRQLAPSALATLKIRVGSQRFSAEALTTNKGITLKLSRDVALGSKITFSSWWTWQEEPGVRVLLPLGEKPSP